MQRTDTDLEQKREKIQSPSPESEGQHTLRFNEVTMKTQPAITHNQVEEAMRQFLKKGGKIEVLFPDLSQELLLKRELKENWDDQLVVPASTESFVISVVDKTVANVAG
ncbi:MAG: hypothetical protein CL911_00020 [Deltaproteobacteria bacterium]|nr:hypothetical protein [Deltaproteobacteria bacterium]